MVLGARLRTVMSSIIRWRKAEILPAGGTEYAEGLLLLMRATVMENPVERHVGDSGNQVGVTTRRSSQPNATRRVSTSVLNVLLQPDCPKWGAAPPTPFHCATESRRYERYTGGVAVSHCSFD